jgi:ribokinase
MTRAPHVVVVGSVNIDLVFRVPRLPRPGETLAGDGMATVPGGKGANQAVAAARLGARVSLVGRVGDDAFGPRLRAGLDAEGVAVDHVRTAPDCPSGVALIGVEPSGENAIVIVAGANGRLTPEDVRDADEVIRSADVLLLQLEVPLETVVAAVAAARRHGVRIILDPAPAPTGPLPEALRAVDVLSPNQTEAEALTRIVVPDPEAARRAAEALRRDGAASVVIKLGAAGALVSEGSGPPEWVPTARVEAVDTTAAGDAFTAALAVELAGGVPLREAARLGCAAGTLAVTRHGAQPAMPTRGEVEAFLPRIARQGGEGLEDRPGLS